VKFPSMAGSVSEGARATLARLHAKADCILVGATILARSLLFFLKKKTSSELIAKKRKKN
jgi:hypothetical protein